MWQKKIILHGRVIRRKPSHCVYVQLYLNETKSLWMVEKMFWCFNEVEKNVASEWGHRYVCWGWEKKKKTAYDEMNTMEVDMLRFGVVSQETLCRWKVKEWIPIQSTAPVNTVLWHWKEIGFYRRVDPKYLKNPPQSSKKKKTCGSVDVNMTHNTGLETFCKVERVQIHNQAVILAEGCANFSTWLKFMKNLK